MKKIPVEEQILDTKNEEWGYWGTIREEKPCRWSGASLQILLLGFTPRQTRYLLDSPLGRHLADYHQDKDDETLPEWFHREAQKLLRRDRYQEEMDGE